MQEPGVILIIIMLALPIIASLAIIATREKSKQTRSIILLTMLALQLLANLAGNIAGSRLASLSLWSGTTAAGSSFLLMHTYLGHTSIACFCLAGALLVAARWSRLEWSDGLVLAGGLFVTTFLALSANLTSITYAIVAYALLRQTQQLAPTQRLRAIILDLLAITALSLAGAVLRASNDTLVLSFQQLQGTGMIVLGIASVLILSQVRFDKKGMPQAKIITLTSLTCGGLLWVTIVRLSSTFPLDGWLLVAALGGMISSAWLYWQRPSGTTLEPVCGYWTSLLIATGFISGNGKHGISLAVYISTILITTMILVTEIPRDRVISRIIRIAQGYCIAGLPGTLSGLATLALLTNLADSHQWGAIILLVLSSALMISGSWRHFVHPQKLENGSRVDIPVSAAVPVLLLIMGIMPGILSLPGSNLLISLSLPSFPPLSNWLVYTLWAAPLVLGAGLTMAPQTFSLRISPKDDGGQQPTKDALTALRKALTTGALGIERALETDWYMPWVLVFAAIVGALLVRGQI